MKFPVNCDMAEGYGIYRSGDDEGCIRFVSHINVACGFHASDPSIMWNTVRMARKYGVGVGAHPGLPDREGFGRRAIKISRAEAAAMTLYQIGALKAFLDYERMPLTHIKPHGALHGMAVTDRQIALGLADGCERFGVPILVIGNSEFENVCNERGLENYREFCADLEYDDDGIVIITAVHDAVDPQRSARRCMRAIREGVTESASGRTIPIRADSITVHADTPNAVVVAEAVWDGMAEIRAAGAMVRNLHN